MNTTFLTKFATKTLFTFVAISTIGSIVVSASEGVDLVLIEKSARKLTLKSGTREMAHYSVALGNSPIGPKRCQGDGKTPEGEYKITGRNIKSAYHRSLRISYPNVFDRKNAEKLECSPGGDIMIHGLPNGKAWIGAAHRLQDWTLGCIAVTSDEIETIWKLVPDGISPIWTIGASGQDHPFLANGYFELRKG